MEFSQQHVFWEFVMIEIKLNRKIEMIHAKTKNAKLEINFLTENSQQHLHLS